MLTNDDSTKIVNLITPGAGALVLGRGYIGKLQYFFSLLVYTRTWITLRFYKDKP